MPDKYVQGMKQIFFNSDSNFLNHVNLNPYGMFSLLRHGLLHIVRLSSDLNFLKHVNCSKSG